MTDYNGNDNCLEGYQCPKCGEYERLFVWTVTKSLMTDEGTEETYDHEWDENSYAECTVCDHGDKSRMFQVANQKPAVGELVDGQHAIVSVVHLEEVAGWVVYVENRPDPVIVRKDFEKTGDSSLRWETVLEPEQDA